MSRQYSNRSFVPSDHSSRRFHQQQRQNDFAYFQYPSYREINNNNHHDHHFNRITTTASFTRHPLWFDYDWEDTKHQQSSTINSSNSHYEQKRSRHDDHEQEQQYRAHHYQPYPNHRPTQIQATNPTPRRVTSFSRSFDYSSHNRHFHHQSSPIVSPHRQSIPSSSSTHHRNEITFEPTSHHSPLFHMATQMHQRSSSSFLLNDLLHRVIDAHAASYNDNHVHYHHSPTASIDLIAYTLMTPTHEIFSLPATFSIQFGDLFDLIIPDETPVVGLTDSELERIPIMIYKNHKSDNKCTICLSEYINGEKLKHLKCKHYFHGECIDPWLKTSTRCPICRGEQTN